MVFGYRVQMAEDLKTILRENVEALLERRAREDPTRKTKVSGLIALGFQNGTAQRILGGETSIGVNVVAQLAEALEVPPWMLLVPRLDVENLPGMTEDASAWPFPLVDQDAYRDLTPSERAFVQGGLARDINELIARRATRRVGNRA